MFDILLSPVYSVKLYSSLCPSIFHILLYSRVLKDSDFQTTVFSLTYKKKLFNMMLCDTH